VSTGQKPSTHHTKTYWDHVHRLLFPRRCRGDDQRDPRGPTWICQPRNSSGIRYFQTSVTSVSGLCAKGKYNREVWRVPLLDFVRDRETVFQTTLKEINDKMKKAGVQIGTTPYQTRVCVERMIGYLEGRGIYPIVSNVIINRSTLEEEVKKLFKECDRIG